MTAGQIVSGEYPAVGVVAGHSVTLHFGNIAAEYASLAEGAMLVDRSVRGRMRFDGPKAAELLTGLVTNDVLALLPGHGQYAAALSPKGRIVADVRIFARVDHLLVDVPPRARAGWDALVRKYINPRVAPYRDVTAETKDIGVFGPLSRGAVASAFDVDQGTLAALQPYSHLSAPVEGGKATVIRIAEIDTEGYEIILPLAAERTARDRMLSEGAIPGSPHTWNIARIEAGRPEWGIDMNDSTIPQEANFDQLEAISYTKGCYTGQETVARVHFRGHVNRFLRRVHFVSATVPPSSAELIDDRGEVVGDVRSVAMSPRYGGVAIAMVRREVPSGATLHARWAGGECTVQIAA